MIHVSLLFIGCLTQYCLSNALWPDSCLHRSVFAIASVNRGIVESPATLSRIAAGVSIAVCTESGDFE